MNLPTEPPTTVTVTLKREKNIFEASFRDIFLLGITVVLGQQYVAWTKGLVLGLGEFVGVCLLVAFAYLCLYLCLAEMTSTLPFSGGSYGFARVTLGPLFGYFLGVADSVEFILRACIGIGGIGTLVTTALRIDNTGIELLIWVLFYALMFYLQFNHTRSKFWHVSNILGISVIILTAMYILGSFGYVDGPKYARMDRDGGDAGFFNETTGNFTGSTVDSFHNITAFSLLPIATEFYMGLEILPLASMHSPDAKSVVPRAMLLTYGCIFVSSIFTMCLAASQYPGLNVLRSSYAPFSYLFGRMFDLDYRTAHVISVPAVVATSYGYVFAYSKQVTAMAKSRLFLVSFTKCIGDKYINLLSLFIGSLIGILALAVTSGNNAKNRAYVYNVCLLGGLTAYIGNFISFIIFRRTYGALKRKFVSPLGVPGAVCGIVIFILVFVSEILYANDNNFGWLLYVLWMIVATCSYMCLSRYTQTYSAEEQAIMFIAYIIKTNRERNSTIAKGRKRRGWLATMVSRISCGYCRWDAADDDRASVASSTSHSRSKSRNRSSAEETSISLRNIDNIKMQSVSILTSGSNEQTIITAGASQPTVTAEDAAETQIQRAGRPVDIMEPIMYCDDGIISESSSPNPRGERLEDIASLRPEPLSMMLPNLSVKNLSMTPKPLLTSLRGTDSPPKRSAGDSGVSLGASGPALAPPMREVTGLVVMMDQQKGAPSNEGSWQQLPADDEHPAQEMSMPAAKPSLKVTIDSKVQTAAGKPGKREASLFERFLKYKDAHFPTTPTVRHGNKVNQSAVHPNGAHTDEETGEHSVARSNSEDSDFYSVDFDNFIDQAFNMQKEEDGHYVESTTPSSANAPLGRQVSIVKVQPPRQLAPLPQSFRPFQQQPQQQGGIQQGTAPLNPPQAWSAPS